MKNPDSDSIPAQLDSLDSDSNSKSDSSKTQRDSGTDSLLRISSKMYTYMFSFTIISTLNFSSRHYCLHLFTNS